MESTQVKVQITRVCITLAQGFTLIQFQSSETPDFALFF